MVTICLNMIVKNEAPIIARCLASVKPFIDHWVIVDTGSSDDTPAVIERAMAGVPGRVEHRPWVNFGHNRAEALALAQPLADYTMVIDADEVMEAPPGFTMPALTKGAYYVTIANQDHDGFRFIRPQLFANRLPWTYQGVLHEAAVCAEPYDHEVLDGVVFRGHFDGARNQTTEDRKYALDALTLERALLDEPNNARYQFYLAQSYRDSGQRERAVEAYKKRVAMGGWDEEVFYSKYQIAEISTRLQGATPAEITALYLDAYQARPSRAEPLYGLACYFRFREQFALAALFAEKAAAMTPPADVLFTDRSIYDWRALDEFAVSAYWAGHRAAAAKANRELLSRDALPERERSRIEENLGFCDAA